MTSDEWSSGTDPLAMLEFLAKLGRASDRKLRLFGCARVRAAGGRSLAIEYAEHLADGTATS